MKFLLPIVLTIFMFLPGIAQSQEQQLENHENLTGTMKYNVKDGLLLIYKIDLFTDRPIDNIYGILQVFDSRDTLTSLASYMISNIKPRNDNDKLFGFRRIYLNNIGNIVTDNNNAYYNYLSSFERLKIHVRQPNIRFKMGEYTSISSFKFAFDTQKRPAGSPPSEWAQKAINEYLVLDKQLNNNSNKSITKTEKVQPVVTNDKNIVTSDKNYNFKYIIVLLLIPFIVCMAPIRAKLRASGMMWYVSGASLVMIVQISGYYPFLPAFISLIFISTRLYSKKYDQYQLIKQYITAAAICLIICSMTAVYMLGSIGYLWSVGWLIGVLVAYYFVSTHLSRYYCLHCNTYGKHTKLTEELVSRKIIETQTSKLKYDHKQETDKEIIEWYERVYGVRIDIWEQFNVYCECCSCHNIFKHLKINHKSKEL